MQIDKQLMKGSLKTVVLQIIEAKPAHGYEIAQTIKQKSDEKFSVTEGTLYPLLNSLEADGFLSSKLIDGDTGRKRKVYKITNKGGKLLKTKKKEWLDFSQTMDALMNKESMVRA